MHRSQAPILPLLAVLLAAPLVLAHDDGRAIRFPDVPGGVTLVADLHTHSVFSDGTVWPTIRVDEARRDGLDVIAVTEHLELQPHADDIPHPDRNRSYELARAHASRGAEDVIVVSGAEITKAMPPGHVNAVFLSDANALRHEDPELAYAAAAEQGAFVFWNHPSWVGQRSDGVARMEPIHHDLIARGLLHGIEVANGVMYSADALAMALEHDLAILGVSDVHGLIDWEADVGGGGHRTVTLVLAAERTPEAVRAALFERATVAWMDNTLIGREEHLRPLVEASLTVASAGRRGGHDLVDIVLANGSDAEFELVDRGGHNLYGHASVIRVPPAGEVVVSVAGELRTTFPLELAVLNAVTAPGEHLVVSLPVTVAP